MKTHGAPDDNPEPKEFADAITADHAIINEDDKSRDGDRVALVIQDRATQWLQSFASGTKSASDTRLAIERFLGLQIKAKYAYSDNSKRARKSLQ